MKTNPTLESVQADFQQWRANKASPRARVPEKLKHKAVNLLTQFSAGQVIKAIGISSIMLTKWTNQHSSVNSQQPKALEFVTLPKVLSTEVEQSSDALKLNVTQANGFQWELQGSVSAAQLTAFISAVGALPGGLQ